MGLFILLTAATVLLSSCADGKQLAGFRGAIPVDEDSYVGRRRDGGFDYLMLTLIYPEAVCRADDDAVPDSCEIPSGTPKWSIHGLWPNFANGSYPQFCRPQKFDVDSVKDIVDEMRRDWPNLYPSKSAESFWAHEWEKHGTCAESDPRFDSQFKYFNTTLLLRTLFDVEAAMNDQGVMPSQDAYTYNQILQALMAGLTKGRRVQFNCLTDKKSRQTLLGDVRLCLDPQLNLIDCPREKYVRPSESFSPHLPTFKPCRDMITYLPSQQELNWEKLTEAVLQVQPGAVLVGLRWPIGGLIVAIVLLLLLLCSLCVANYRLFAQNLEETLQQVKEKTKEKMRNYSKISQPSL